MHELGVVFHIADSLSYFSAGSTALGAVNPETLALGLDRAGTEMLFDQRLISQEAVGDNP